MQNVIKRIIEIIVSNFPNGIRGDFIDINKVFRIYSANYSDEIISRDLICNVIHVNGIEDSNRFYFISKDNAKNIRLLLNEILESCSVVYYSSLYERHRDFFVNLHIFSPEVLKKILKETCTEYFYFDEFCSKSRMTRLDYEVSKIFMAADNSLSLEDLQKKLPYVPEEKTLALLNNTKKYLSTKTSRFIPIYKIKFDLDEIHAANRQISSLISINGYASPEDYDLSSNFVLNPELNEIDLRNVIYEKFLSADFTRRGKRLFGNDNKVNCSLSKELERFVRDHDEISFEDLVNHTKKVNNYSANSIFKALTCALKFMVRVSEDLFVRDSLMSFDVAGIDEALASFVQDKIIPLRAVTSFTGFPPVEGYSWNLFLLESFLCKYSKKYTYDTPAINNSNVGAIYPKSMKFADYLDVQVAVVVQEELPLEKSIIEDFLVGQGFRARRIDKVTEKIIELVQRSSLK